MNTVDEALTLLRRQAEIESAMRQPGGIRILEERELHHLRAKSKQYPETKAVMEVAHALRRPVSQVTAQDVERWAIAKHTDI